MPVRVFLHEISIRFSGLKAEGPPHYSGPHPIHGRPGEEESLAPGDSLSLPDCLGGDKASSWHIGTHTAGPPGSPAFRLRLGFAPPAPMGLPLCRGQTVGLLSCHNHRRQFLRRNIFLSFFFSFPTTTAYGSSQARGPIGATTAGLHHSLSNNQI